MKFILVALFAVAAAHRLSFEEQNASLSIEKQTASLRISPLEVFNETRILDAQHTTPAIFKINEIPGFKQAKYEIYKNGQMISFQRRKGYTGTGHLIRDPQHLDAKGRPVPVLRSRVSRGWSASTPDKVYMTSPNGKDVFYTFTAVNSWGQSKKKVKEALGGFKSNAAFVAGTWSQEVFVADFGWCRGAGAYCGNVAAYARCDKMARRCVFFDADQQPMGEMLKVGKGVGQSGVTISKVESYSLKIDKPGQDGLMLAHFGAFIDLANNRERKRERKWEIAAAIAEGLA